MYIILYVQIDINSQYGTTTITTTDDNNNNKLHDSYDTVKVTLVQRFVFLSLLCFA